MTVLDTHAWVWWVADPDRLSDTARTVIERDAELGVCTISVWEVATLARKQRLAFDRPVDVWISQALGRPRMRPIELDATIALAVGTLTDEFPGDPADRIIYTTARAMKATLVTRDRELLSFDSAIAVW